MNPVKRLAEQFGKKFRVHASPFGEADQQGGLRIGDLAHRFRSDGPLPEDGGLACLAGFTVEAFNRQEQRLVRVTAKHRDIAPVGKWTELSHEAVVVLVQPQTGRGQFLLAVILPLGAETIAEGVTDTDQPAEPLGRRRSQV